MKRISIVHATLMERPIEDQLIVFGLLEINPSSILEENAAIVLKTSHTEQGIFTLSPDDVALMQTGMDEDPRVLTVNDYLRRPVWASLKNPDVESQNMALNMIRVLAAEPDQGRYILFGAGDMPLMPRQDSRDRWFKLTGNDLSEVSAPASTRGGNINTILNMPIWEDCHGDRYKLSYLSSYAMEGVRQLHALYLEDSKGLIDSDTFKARLTEIQDTYILGYGDHKNREYRDYLVQLDALCPVSDRHKMIMSAAEAQEISRCSQKIIKAQMTGDMVDPSPQPSPEP